MKVLTAVLRLYCLQIFAFLAISLSTYFPGWDLILSGVYLVVLTVESRLHSGLGLREKFLVLMAWQGGALFLAFYVWQGWTFWGLCDYGIFALQFWSAPLLPWWALIHIPLSSRFPCYYYLVLITPLLLSVWYFLISWPTTQKSAGYCLKY
ncbi:MAG TPA: hypothetical protein VN426_09755 [Syntrophomonadaceae bacterium]|nr:hypothetical protein [Syntrophomonadaceae bacterium]